MDDFESYNEVDIMSKLSEMKIPLDPVTGEITSLKELNSLGKKKIITDPCYGDKKSTKCRRKIFILTFKIWKKKLTILFWLFIFDQFIIILVYMITALQKLLKKTTDASTKSGIEEYVTTLFTNSNMYNKLNRFFIVISD